MNKLWICSMFIALNSVAFSQSTQLKGTVKETISGKEISDVSILVQNKNQGVITNKIGYYELHLADGEYTIQYSALGYKTEIKNIKINEGEQTLHVRLSPDDIQLSEIVIQSNKEKEVGINRISKLALKLRPISSAQDLLRTVPGLFIAQHAGGGKAEQIFLRGFDNDHGTDFAILVDDIPINLSSHGHGQGYADLHFLIPETIGDANYYKGPHDASLGNFAVSGAASYQTKNTLSKNVLKLEYGQYDFVRALGMFNLLDEKNFLSKNHEHAYIAIEGTYNKSFFESPQNLRRLNSLTKYILDINELNTLTTSFSTFHSEWNASGQIPLRAINSGLINRFGAIDTSEGGDTKRIQFSSKLASQINKKTTLSNQIYYVSNKYNLFSNFSFFLNDPVNSDMIHQNENRNIFGYSGKLHHSSNLGPFKSNLEVGLGAQYTQNDIFLNTVIKRDFLENINRFDIKEANYSIYLKEFLKLTPKLSTLIGFRSDYFTFNVHEITPAATKQKENAFRVSPKISFFYDISKNFQLYAKASSGYHSNYAQSAVNEPTIHPLPRAIGYDLGTEFKIGENFIANVVGWYLKSDAEYVFVSDGFEFENKGRSERIGADISFRYQPVPYLWFDTDINYSHGTLLDEPSNANKIPSAPSFTSTGGVTLKFKNKITGSLRYRYLAERFLVEDESVKADAYFLVDAVINYRKAKYEIGISIENIFDQVWTEAVFYDESQLQNEVNPVNDFHLTPGTPIWAKLNLTYFF